MRKTRNWILKTKSSWQVDNLFFSILVHLATLFIFSLFFAFFVSTIWSLPTSVNYSYTNRLWMFLSIPIGICLLLLLYLKVSKSEEFVRKNHFATISPGDLTLLLVPLTFITQYIINNQDILSPPGSLYVLVYMIIFSSIFIFALPLLFSRIASSRSLMLLGLAFVITIASMALISRHFNWFESGNSLIQSSILSIIFLAFFFLYKDKNKHVIRVAIVASFAITTTNQWLSVREAIEKTSQPIEENKLLQIIEGKKPIHTPNIYFLIYDAYVSNETMLAYGIDNQPQEEYLLKEGFELYPHTYSLASSSTATIGRVLNASNQLLGNPRIPISGNGIVQNTLESFGYETYGVFPNDFFFRGVGSTYDFSFPLESSPPEILLSGIFMGEFRFDIAFDDLDRELFIATKQSIFENNSPNPRFIHTHSDLPKHSQNSGACLPDEIDRFRERLITANFEMRQDVETILKNDPDALVIIAGDHGPYLTKNCTTTDEGGYDISEINRLDIQDRFGSFLAIRWPSENYGDFDDITVLQDLFPTIFAFLLDDKAILSAKIQPSTVLPDVISGASVHDGIIYGGIDDSRPLFISNSGNE